MSADDAAGLLAMLLSLGGAVAALAWWRLAPVWRARRLAAIQARPFPPAWRRILRQRVPLVAQLPPDLQQRLKGLVQVFLADKAFVGCQGQAIDDEVRVTIAGQACLLLLGQPPAHDGQGVYPGAAPGAGLPRAVCGRPCAAAGRRPAARPAPGAVG